jgi:hypothetical protein
MPSLAQSSARVESKRQDLLLEGLRCSAAAARTENMSWLIRQTITLFLKQ